MLKVGRWLLVLGMVGSVLAIGSLDRHVLAVVALVITTAMMLAVLATEPYRPRRSASMLVAVAIGLLAWTMLQAVPLPAGLVRALSPHAADVWARCLRPLGESGPAWHPLTLDPPATHLEMLRGATYLATLIGALAIAREREGARFLVRALIVSGVLLAASSVVHVALGAEKVWGFFRPKTPVGWVAPLLNPNQAGGYVNIALMLLGSAAISKAPVMRRLLAILGVVGLAAFEIWNASRGAVGTMVLGLIALVLLHQRRSRSTPVLAVVLPTVLTLGGVGMLVLGFFESSAHGIGDTDLSKLGVVWRAISTMVPAYPVFGAGRGAFEASFPEYMNVPHEGFVVFTHPENIVAQWLCEWGVVVTALAFVVLAIALRSRNALARGELAIGPWVALAVVGLQNLVDFSSETPGVMIALVICAALVTSGKGHDENVAARAFEPRWVATGCAALVGLCCLFSFERAELLVDAKPHAHDVLAGAHVERDARIAFERRVMLDHPAEPYFALTGGLRALADKENVLPWIERTLERAPVYAPAHVVLARWLRARSPSHARVEYRIAAEERSGASPTELAPLVASFDDALEVAPAGEQGVDTLDALAALFTRSRPATREQLDAEIERRNPGRPSVLVRRAVDGYLDAASPEVTPWCDGWSCTDQALRRANELERRVAGSSVGYVLGTRVMFLRGEGPKALAQLRDACASVVDRNACLLALAGIATSTNSAEAEADIEALGREGCPWSDACTQNLLWAAGLEQSRHSLSRALVYLRRAAAMDPDRADLQESVAQQASATSLHGEAASIYEHLATVHPETSRYVTQAQAERALADGTR